MSESVIYCKACGQRMNVGLQIESTSSTMFKVYPPVELQDEMLLRCEACGETKEYMLSDLRTENASGD